jgi:hypothetical protein
MALLDLECFGLSTDIHGDSLAPDWLSAEHETGVSNVTFCNNVFVKHWLFAVTSELFCEC